MALAIDTRHLLERWLPDQEDYLDTYVGSRGRFQLHRVFASATVARICNSSTMKGQVHFDQIVQQAALNWPQADPEDIESHEAEMIYHHLQSQLAAATPSTSHRMVTTAPATDESAVTTLFACVESPSFIPSLKGRPLSAFHCYSVRMIMEEKGNGHSYASKTSLSDVIPDVTRRGRLWACVHDPKILWASNTSTDVERYNLSVVWHIQLDFVDLHSPISITPPEIGRSSSRLTLNDHFQQVPSISRCEEEGTDAISRGEAAPEAKRFKGVRYRKERRTWVAEMKPPRSKNKVSFGDFKSQMEAARAVDAAFHHFGKPLNFADSAQLLLMLPTGAAEGLNDEAATLKLVKENAKRLASIAASIDLSFSHPSTSLPSTVPPAAPTPEPLEVSDSSSICTAVTAGLFRSYSEITLSTSSGGSDRADDGISQLDPNIAGFVHSMEPEYPLPGTYNHGGVVNYDPEDCPCMFLGGVDYAVVDPCDVMISSELYASGTRSTQLMDCPELEQPFKIQRTCVADLLILSPTTPSFHV